MKPLQTLLRLVFACLILMLVQALAGILLPLGVQGPNPGPWWLISNGIVAAVLTLVALRAPWKGWQLALVLSALPMTIQLVNLVEGLAFLTHVGLPWQRLMLMTLLAYILALPLWRLLFGRNERTASTPAAPYSGAAWRLPVSAALYVLLYIGAGMIIFPFVKTFYATQTLPGPGSVVALQFFLRGPLFVALCLLLQRGLRIEGAAGHLAVGIAFTLLSGVAPMIAPNPFFPDAIRWVHLGEITVSNFLLGVLVSWLWKPTR